MTTLGHLTNCLQLKRTVYRFVPICVPYSIECLLRYQVSLKLGPSHSNQFIVDFAYYFADLFLFQNPIFHHTHSPGWCHQIPLA